MVLAKSKNTVGLGNSLMNDRFGKGRGADMRKANFQGETGNGIVRTAENGDTYVTNHKKEASWVKMRSVTEQAALDEFLTTAQLAGTDFTAEKINSTKIIETGQRNPYLLSAEDERKTLKKHKSYRNQLIVPRRPKWDSNTTPQQLGELERESFMEWRRRLAYLQEGEDLLMTPFERNLEVWRQLWRVIERSDLVVQIVDARNPLHFRSEDLEKYVKEIDSNKTNLLLVNKADMMSETQRHAWVQHLQREKINFRFFSAVLAKEQNELRTKLEEEAEQSDSETEDELEGESDEDESETDVKDEPKAAAEVEESATKEIDENASDPLTPAPMSEFVAGLDPAEQELMRIITTEELEALFLAHAPKLRTAQSTNVNTTDSSAVPKQERKINIGLVGYPNVGKSSTINALIGSKKVSVSATPGKTKHFQTIHLSDEVILCDCPGLVFPNFATTKAELVCNGILPIDQLREFLGPVGLVAKRVPQAFLEALYGIKVRTKLIEEGGTGVPTASEILRSYARARGFATTGLGQPDESRAARYVLKDYVKGRLPFVHPPPALSSKAAANEVNYPSPLEIIDPTQFNLELYDVTHLPAHRRGAFEDDSAHVKDTIPLNADVNPPSVSDLSIADQESLISASTADSGAVKKNVQAPQGQKPSRSQALDQAFFDQQGKVMGSLRRPFQYKYTEQGAVATGKVQAASSGKKHYKGSATKRLVPKGNSFMED